MKVYDERIVEEHFKGRLRPGINSLNVSVYAASGLSLASVSGSVSYLFFHLWIHQENLVTSIVWCGLRFQLII